MKLKLKKNITIKKGTIFDTAPTKTLRDKEHVDCIFGLTKNTYGTVTYDISKDYQKEWSKWFEVVKQSKKTGN